ncbi:hypothetical protein AU106_gp212 [Sinorhizobium phage phiM9]|uniref:Uncharacterized protein n=1 Tax=Sinorhizobium phage phiM9 TaxID=1636182 RepID=A0A0F6R7Q1_9CAUD|nr:hypothetical protein AU106_gp212 [Sinorhizobium phage phiM9]AKE44843.1 hypothetical protein Sm_phiM9_216 [Sinorhizobium phage phiM9]
MTKEHPKTFFNIYIGTGGKNVLFTLRIHRWTEGNPFDRDSYVRNLANDLERA